MEQNYTLIKKVEGLGLTEKQSQVYIALLSNGPSTADQISKFTKLNRSTTYVQIEFLMVEGLVSKFKDGKKTKFNAESPVTLEDYLKKQAQDLKSREVTATSLIPDLLGLFQAAEDKPLVRYFEGKQGLTKVREGILKSKSKEYYAAASVDHLNNIYTKDERDDFSVRRVKKNIGVHLMYTSTNTVIPTTGNMLVQRIDKKQFPFKADVYVYDDIVSFANTSEKVGGVIIESKAIADTMRSIFKIAWHMHSKQNDT